MKLLMDKQLRNNGFTMIEMILVLMVLSICILLFPLYHLHQNQLLSMRMEQLKVHLIKYQTYALHHKVKVSLRFQNTLLLNDGITYELDMKCKGELTFNASGNVNHAMSIPCVRGNAKKELIIQLGSGRMYVK